jgi:N-acetylglutamate synthase-like GNAT family acetyltransferase
VTDGVILRRALACDVPAIAALINRFAAENRMLPRTGESIALTLEDFVVATDARGAVLACGALKEYSPSLAEVASVAVAPEAHGRRLGTAILRQVEALARRRGVEELFALTLTPRFFEVSGYEVVDKTRYPEKIRRDCAGCVRQFGCVEICVRRMVGSDEEAVAA